MSGCVHQPQVFIFFKKLEHSFRLFTSSGSCDQILTCKSKIVVYHFRVKTPSMVFRIAPLPPGPGPMTGT